MTMPEALGWAVAAFAVGFTVSSHMLFRAALRDIQKAMDRFTEAYLEAPRGSGKGRHDEGGP